MMRAKLKATIAEQDVREQNEELAYAAIRRLRELTKPLNDGLLSLYSRTLVDSRPTG